MIELRRPRAFYDREHDVLHANRVLEEEVVGAGDEESLLHLILDALPSKDQRDAFTERMNLAFTVRENGVTLPRVMVDIL